MNNPEKPYLTTKQAANILQVSPNTMANWRHKRRGPAYSIIGKQTMYSQEAIKDFFYQCQKKKEVQA